MWKLTGDQICARGHVAEARQGRGHVPDTCSGDSGGGLVARWDWRIDGTCTLNNLLFFQYLFFLHLIYLISVSIELRIWNPRLSYDLKQNKYLV